MEPRDPSQALVDYFPRAALEVLNAEQRTKFEKLQGTKIDATQLRDALIPEGAEF
jgi:hypothetical protein